MKTVFFSPSRLLLMLFSFALLFTTSESSAQDRKAAPTLECVESVLGHIDGNVILWKQMSRATASKTIDLCKCATKHMTKPKNCVDRRGSVIVNQGNEPEGGDRAARPGGSSNLNFQILAGKRNCRLISVDEKVLMISGNTVKVGTECHCNNVQNCGCKGEPECDCDCSCKSNEKWNFKAVNDKDPSEGFYIVTQERDPRAIMRSGDGVALRHLNRMDGKMKALSTWNIFINDRTKNGVTQYMLRAQDRYDKILAVDSKTSTLKIVNHTFSFQGPDATESDRSAAKPTAGNTASPFVMMKDWKCECVF